MKFSIPVSVTSEEIPAAGFAKKNQQVLGLNDTTVAQLQNLTVSCGYQKVIDAATYPPKGKIPLPNGNQDIVVDGCDVADMFYNAATDANPCFNICKHTPFTSGALMLNARITDRVTDKCPTPPGNVSTYRCVTLASKCLVVHAFSGRALLLRKNIYKYHVKFTKVLHAYSVPMFNKRCMSLTSVTGRNAQMARCSSIIWCGLIPKCNSQPCLKLFVRITLRIPRHSSRIFFRDYPRASRFGTG